MDDKIKAEIEKLLQGALEKIEEACQKAKLELERHEEKMSLFGHRLRQAEFYYEKGEHEVTQRHTFPIPGNGGIGVEFQGHLVCLKGVLMLSFLVIELCLPQTVTEEGHLLIVPLQFQFGLLAGLLYLFQGPLQELLYLCLYFIIHNSEFGLLRLRRTQLTAIGDLEAEGR